MPDHGKISSGLSEITPSKPSLYKQISTHHLEIETAIKNGASYADLVAYLGANGLEISTETFTKYLYRMRLKSGRIPRQIAKKCPVERVFWSVEKDPPSWMSSIELYLQFRMPENYKDWFWVDEDHPYGFCSYKIPKGTNLNAQLRWILNGIKDWNYHMEPLGITGEADEWWNQLQAIQPTDNRRTA